MGLDGAGGKAGNQYQKILDGRTVCEKWFKKNNLRMRGTVSPGSMIHKYKDIQKTHGGSVSEARKREAGKTSVDDTSRQEKKNNEEKSTSCTFPTFEFVRTGSYTPCLLHFVSSL